MKDNEMIEAGKNLPRTKGRGGTNNFGNNTKELVKTDLQRKVAKQLLQETVSAYKQEKVYSDEELAKRISDYFDGCANSGQIPTVEEMCLFTGYAQSTIWDWETGRRGGFSSETADIIKKAKDFLQTFDAKLTICGQMNFLTYCFRAKNYYGMKDVQDVVLTPNNPLGDAPSQKQLEEHILNSLPNGGEVVNEQ